MPASLTIKKTTEKRLIWLHILGCVCFIILPFLFFPRPQDIFEPFNNPATIRDFIGQFLLTGFFYLLYYVLIPTYYQPKKYVAFVLIVTACFVFITLLPSLITGRFNESPPSFRQFPPHSHGGNNQLPPDFSQPPDEQNSFNQNQRELSPFQNDNSVLGFVKEINHYIFLFLVVLFFSLMVSINNRWKETQKE